MHYGKIGAEILNGFWSLLYPHLCLICGQAGLTREEQVCLTCHYHLAKTKDWIQKENAFTERFWGRLQIENGAAYYQFVKGGLTQSLLHQLKYNGKKDLGIYVGQLFGSVLKEGNYFNGVDMIIPVPLHSKKQHIRGYNQSTLFAKGLAQELGIPFREKILIRTLNASSQTQKTRMERFNNMVAAFEVTAPQLIINQHILLVDDVLTTGATLEACGSCLLKVPGTRLSMATIARANL